jgi:hypothetical protein
VDLLRSWEKGWRTATRARATGWAETVVDRILVWIFLSNGCTFFLEWGLSMSITVTVRWSPSARVYIRGWEATSDYERTHVQFSDALRTTHSCPTFCEHREWESRHPKSPSVERHFHGCAGDHVFSERTRDCSLRPLDQRWSSSWSPTPFVGLHCKHLSASTAYDYMNIHTRCLMWIEPLMPWSSVPPQGTHCSYYLCIFYCYLLFMWVVIHI